MDEVIQPYTAMPSLLETERLLLRQRTKEDAYWNLELLNERNDGKIRTLNGVEKQLVEQHVQASANGFGFLTITRIEDGDVVGYCGPLIGRTTVDEPEIAFELFRRAHGNGYATEAVEAVLKAIFATGRRRVWATVRSWNVPSFRVLEKNGFSRDHSTIDEQGELVWMVREV